MSTIKFLGKGVNDADYTQQKKVIRYENGKRITKTLWVCPYYKVWSNMLIRCYSQAWKSKHPTYDECEVCDEWLTFSKFKNWMSTQSWEGRELDKDLLAKDFRGKLYCPECCVFLDRKTNTFTLDCGVSSRGKLVGAQFREKCGKYQSQIHNPFTGKREHLGLFLTEIEAHCAWKTRKHQFALMLADLQEDNRVSEKLRNLYKTLLRNNTKH